MLRVCCTENDKLYAALRSISAKQHEGNGTNENCGADDETSAKQRSKRNASSKLSCLVYVRTAFGADLLWRYGLGTRLNDMHLVSRSTRQLEATIYSTQYQPYTHPPVRNYGALHLIPTPDRQLDYLSTKRNGYITPQSSGLLTCQDIIAEEKKTCHVLRGRLMVIGVEEVAPSVRMTREIFLLHSICTGSKAGWPSQRNTSSP